MAANLNYASGSSWCYGLSPDNCAKYGRLYTWEAALGACPAGWHLPTKEEWNTLVRHVGVPSTAGRFIKSKTGWNDSGNGTDDYGYSALPGGNRTYDDFYNVGNSGDWWSATEGAAEDGAGLAYYRYVYYRYERVDELVGGKEVGRSVRCVATSHSAKTH
jgi:uncharacterized protein (TIGR02145 family)